MKQGEEKLNGKLVVLFIVVIACSLAIQAGLALEKTALNPDYYRSLLGDPGLQQSIYSRLWQGDHRAREAARRRFRCLPSLLPFVR